MTKYRRKQICLIAHKIGDDEWPDKFWKGILSKKINITSVNGKMEHVIIDTLEGRMKGELGDYIICGVDGEFYPCKEEIFNRIYEIVEE